MRISRPGKAIRPAIYVIQSRFERLQASWDGLS